MSRSADSETGKELAPDGGGLGRRALRILGGAGLFMAIICFAFGLSLPIVELKQFFVFKDGYSILSMIGTLISADERLLASIVGIFAILFPALKFIVLGAILSRARKGGKTHRLSLLLDTIGKWSMLDVLIVAVLVVAIKVTGLQTAATQPGLYFFAAAVILTGAVSWIARRIMAQP